MSTSPRIVGVSFLSTIVPIHECTTVLATHALMAATGALICLFIWILSHTYRHTSQLLNWITRLLYFIAPPLLLVFASILTFISINTNINNVVLVSTKINIQLATVDVIYIHKLASFFPLATLAVLICLILIPVYLHVLSLLNSCLFYLLATIYLLVISISAPLVLTIQQSNTNNMLSNVPQHVSHTAFSALRVSNIPTLSVPFQLPLHPPKVFLLLHVTIPFTCICIGAHLYSYSKPTPVSLSTSAPRHLSSHTHY